MPASEAHTFSRAHLRIIKPLFLIAISFMFSGCGTRPTAAVLQTAALTAPAGKTVTVYVTTTRTPDKDGLGYGDGKAKETHYVEYTISIPPAHKAGKIEYPDAHPDPNKSFVVIAQRELDRNTFLTVIAARSRKEAGVFVHGFNYSFQESLFRLAQMSADSQVDGVPILFSWPSSAAVTGYVADKEAATYSRDALALLLEDVSKQHFSRTIVFGHSMGGWLTLEALRQLRLTGKDRTLDRLTVILAAPDIDLDVFRKDVETIGKLQTPMALLVSSDDRALKVSGFLSRDKRIGALDIRDPAVSEAAKRFNIAVVDISNLEASDSLNHDRYVALASAYGQLRGNGEPSGFRKAGAFVFDAVGATVSTPFSVASNVIGGQ